MFYCNKRPNQPWFSSAAHETVSETSVQRQSRNLRIQCHGFPFSQMQANTHAHRHTHKMHATKLLTYLFCVILMQLRLLTWRSWELKPWDVTHSRNCKALLFFAAFTNQTRCYQISRKYGLKHALSRIMPFTKPRKAPCTLGYVCRFMLNRVGHLRLSIAPKDLILHVLLIQNSHLFHIYVRRTGNAELFTNKQVNSQNVCIL